MYCTNGVRMRTSIECLPCIVRQAVDACKMVTDNNHDIATLLKEVLCKLSHADLALTPPEIVQLVHILIQEKLNHPDPYCQMKELSTLRAKSLAEDAQSSINNTKFPFYSAVAFSIAANILDFGMRSEWNEDVVVASFLQAERKNCLDTAAISQLYNEISSAKTVLVLGDNTGESVFDRILIEHFPGHAKIFYAVKDSPIINDATVKEARDSDIHTVAEIISNGTNIPGTVIGKCSSEFINIFTTADVVISKGQGNFETLNENLRKIWFLFQVKCPVIAQHYNYQVGDWLIIRNE